MSRQASRCNDTQRHVHTQRQRALGERMVGEHDRPRLLEVAATFLALAAMAAYASHHNLFPFH